MVHSGSEHCNPRLPEGIFPEHLDVGCMQHLRSELGGAAAGGGDDVSASGLWSLHFHCAVWFLLYVWILLQLKAEWQTRSQSVHTIGLLDDFILSPQWSHGLPMCGCRGAGALGRCSLHLQMVVTRCFVLVTSLQSSALCAITVHEWSAHENKPRLGLMLQW